MEAGAACQAARLSFLLIPIKIYLANKRRPKKYLAAFCSRLQKELYILVALANSYLKSNGHLKGEDVSVFSGGSRTILGNVHVICRELGVVPLKVIV